MYQPPFRSIIAQVENKVNQYKLYEYKLKKGADFIKKEYKVTSYHPEVTEEEKEEIYKQIADIFIRMAQKDFEKNNK